MELQNNKDLNDQFVNSDEKIWSVVAYASVLVILPLIFKQNSKYCQFHASQGAALFLASFAILLLSSFLPYLGLVLFLGYAALSIISMIKAWKGTEWKIPKIYQLGQKMALQKIFMKSSSPNTQNPSANTPLKNTPPNNSSSTDSSLSNIPKNTPPSITS